jgi:uncharacterized BrkB/YihY/UPF0761 family membrane protein
MNARRYFILIFAVVGIALVFVQQLVFHLLAPYERVGAFFRHTVPITPIRMLAANLAPPALFLAAVSAALWLSLSTPAPPWTRRRWPWAIFTYYLFQCR